MMFKVLVPTDFSTHSYNALNYAQMLFQDVEVSFTLLHAYEPSALQLLGNISPQRLASVYQSLKIKAEEHLQATKIKIELTNEYNKHQFETQAVEGHLRDVIMSLQEDGFDYLVMGSKGATGLKELFIGSETYSVVSLHQNIPILIIPEKAVFEIPRKIGFETDFKKSYSKKELEPLTKLARIWDSSLHTVQVYDKPELTNLQEEHLESLEFLLGNMKHDFHVIPRFASKELCINTFDSELEINLLVLIDYPQKFFEKFINEPVIKKMTFHTSLPFLILPAHDS